MKKILFSAALTSALLFPGGAVFAQNDSSLRSTAPWSVTSPWDPVVSDLLVAGPPRDSIWGSLTAKVPLDMEAKASLPALSTTQAMIQENEKLLGKFRSRILERSLAFLGVPYKWGGAKADEGFDCSGFVRQVFADVTGRLLPRTAKEQSEEGQVIARSELKPGDLVFFNTMRRAFSHVGIYLGNNLFAHAPRKGAHVRVDDLTASYWVRTYEGARRPEIQ